MIEWIECNLPWDINLYSIIPTRPDLSDDKYLNASNVILDSIRQKRKSKEIELFGTEGIYLKPEELRVKYSQWDELIQINNEYGELSSKIIKYTQEHPKIIAWQEKCKELENQIDSFCKRGLNQSGTLIQVLENDKTKTYLIGDINVECGIFNEDVAFPPTTIVLRYAKIYSHEIEEK